MTDKEKIAMLRNALEEAQAHLDYCGWGDSWERECAYHNGIPQLIDNALEETK